MINLLHVAAYLLSTVEFPLEHLYLDWADTIVDSNLIIGSSKQLFL